MTMLLIALAIIAAALAGAASGAFAARWLLRCNQRRQVQPQPVPVSDPALDAEIGKAAAAWANTQGRPEAAGLAADKMHLIRHIAQRRGWWS
jgi:hypothetical protein